MSTRDRITRLGKETALYGLSTVAGRMVNFLLVPLYANYLLPSENGVIATLYSYVAFVAVVYGLGMEQSFMRHWVEVREDERGTIFRTSMLGVLPGMLATGLAVVFPAEVAGWMGYGEAEAGLVRFAAIILALDNLAVVPFALLRMERRPLRFAAFKVAGILGTVGLTIVLVVFRDGGALGVFTANLAASGAVAATLLFTLRRWFVRSDGAPLADAARLRQLFGFGIPLVPAGLAGIALQVVDRPIVKAFTDDATVGLYQLNARLAIFMTLAVGMFDFAWRPFFLQHAEDEDARDLFSQVFTYFTSFLLGIFLVVSLFVEDLVRFPFGGATFFPEYYWQGTSIVPVFLVANMLTGLYVVFLTGVYLSKRTTMVPVISGVAAIVTIAGNIILLPSLGIMGAAIAALAGRIVQARWMYAVGQRLYPVRYAWRKVAPVTIWTGLLYGTVSFLSPLPLTAGGIAMKVFAVILFVAGLFAARIITPQGLRRIVSLGMNRTGTDA